MMASMIPVSTVIGLLERAKGAFPSATELVTLLCEWPDKDLPFRSSHSASLAESLAVKYSAAVNQGVGVQGLDQTLEGLRSRGEEVVNNTLVEGVDRFFLVMLDVRATRVLGLMRVLPLVDGRPQAAGE